MEKRTSKLILDGEEFSISEDGKHIKGKKKEYSKDDFHDEVGRDFPFLEVIEEGIVYGFSNEEKLEKWLKEKNLFEEYEKHKEWEKRIKKKRSPEENEKIKQYQIRQVKKDTDNFKKLMKKHNLKEEQIREMDDILKDYDPHFKPKHHSLYLYDYVWYGGRVLKLRGGDACVGGKTPRTYPDLGFFNFDNKANSAKLNCRSHAYLYAGRNYEWPFIHIKRDYVDLNTGGYVWRNSASSAIVY